MKKIYFLFSLAIFLLIPLTTEAAATKKNGEFCTGDPQCLSGDCEDHVCDCSDSASCAAGLQSGSAANWICFDEEKDPLKRGNDFCVKTGSTYANGSTPPDTNNSDVFYPINDKLRIGELCPDEDDTCLTKNCEKSDETYSNGETKYYCTCNESKDCSVAYGGETNDWRCEGDDNNDLSYCKNDKTGNTILATNVSYRDITLSDVLEPEGLAASFQNDLANIIQKPQPKIPIPGLNFSEVDLAKMSSVDETGTSWLNMPFLGEYISAIYKYGMIVLSLAAVIGIIIGGVTLITSGGNSESTNSAKKRIVMSVLGLVIAATSYTILYAVNPELVNLRNIKVILVKGEAYSIPDNEEEYMVSASEASSNPPSQNTTPSQTGTTPSQVSPNQQIIPARVAQVDNPQNLCFPISNGFVRNSNNWGQARKISIPLKTTNEVKQAISKGDVTQTKKIVQCHQGLDLITDGKNGNGTVISMSDGKVIGVMKKNFTTCKNGKSNNSDPGQSSNDIGMITVYDSVNKLTYVYGEINGDTVNLQLGDTVTKGQVLGIASKCLMLHLEIYKGRGRQTGDKMSLGGYTVGMGNWYLYDDFNLGEIPNIRGNRECAQSPYIEILDKIHSTLLDPTDLIEKIKNNTCN